MEALEFITIRPERNRKELGPFGANFGPALVVFHEVFASGSGRRAVTILRRGKS